jgi:hypothetical protein
MTMGMIGTLAGKLNKHLSNLPGWRTGRKLVVIESDDWGSVRMPSLTAFEAMRKAGMDMDSEDFGRYNQNDTLANKEDFAALYEVLSRHVDRNGANPVITAVAVVANPDFEKIRQHDFREYYYEPFPVTLERYGHDGAFAMWKEGLAKGLFVPQFHGREHLNVAAWMRALQSGEREVRLAFDHGCWGYNNKHSHGLRYQAAFDLEFAEDLKIQAEVIRSGLALFEQLFGYKATFFVPPNGPYNNSLDRAAADAGVRYMSSPKLQHEVLGEGKTRLCFHYMGQKNKHGQYYITRNCVFEPNIGGKDWVDSCLKEMSIAFAWGKPAVISSHRVNYIGGLNPENRTHGLRELDSLLRQVVKQWPDVEFITSSRLGKMIEGK